MPTRRRPALYNIWKAIVQRCENPRHDAYPLYGGRGITVCQRWRRSYAAFAADMGERPSLLHTVDRIDVNGHYERDNCRWATRKEQSNNRRDNSWLEWRGRIYTRAQAADAVGISRGLLQWRLARGWPVERALEQRVRGRAD
jgi:hypothetical protein